MMDRFIDKVMRGAASVYMPKLEAMAEMRKTELEEIRAKVRTHPDQVEGWFDKEIRKLDNVDIESMMKNAMSGS
jgi:hypothetical protein